MAATSGATDVALEACERSLALSTDPASRTYASGFLGLAHVERGDPAPAIPLLEDVTRELERFGFPHWHGLFTIALAEAFRLQGELGRAAEVAERGLQISHGAQYWYAVGFGHRVLGRIAIGRRALDAAQESFDEALRTFTSIGAPLEIARTRLEMAALAFGHGDEESAGSHLRDAHRTFSELSVSAYVRRATQLAAERGVALAEPPTA